MNSKWLTIGLGVAAIFLLWLIAGDYPEKAEIKRQLGDLRSKMESLKKEEEGQSALIEYLKTESYLEKQARLRLNLKKEGEEVVFVYRKDNGEEEVNEEKQNEDLFLSKIKEWFRIIWSRE